MKKQETVVDWHKFENEARSEGYKIICGVDEAGRARFL